MDYEKKYKEALERAKEKYTKCYSPALLDYIFPELKSEDVEIRRSIIRNLKRYIKCIKDGYDVSSAKDFVVKEIDKQIAWLEKQGDTNETINKDEFAQCVLKGTAINLITWIDYNAAEGNMCLSNMECKDVEDALVSGDWNKIYAYIKKKLESNEKTGYSFDFEKKELKKLGQPEVTKTSGQEEMAEIPFGAKDSELQEATYFIPKGFHAEIDNDKVVIKKGEKPTAWNEEDEKMLNSIIEDFGDGKTSNMLQEYWLKSLKQRIGG